MELLLVGLNHRTAPVEVRERLAFDADQAASALDALIRAPGVDEALILSTCNRVEFYAAGEKAETILMAIRRSLADDRGLGPADLDRYFTVLAREEAVRHVFRVASSLDSMVLGEPQILGQVKEAFRLAVSRKATGVILNRLFHRAFAVAKRVRRETGIGDSAVSISYAAVELAKKIFGDLSGRKVLLVGAGEMAELAVEHLMRQRIGEVFVANRTFERGVDLARRFSGTPIRFDEIAAHLAVVDIIISSTGAPGIVLARRQVQGVMRKRKNRPIFFIDIAVPRDIDPEINRVSNAYVYDIDDLAGVVEENRDRRRQEAVRAERIVSEGVVKFFHWFDGLDVVPTIKAMREKMEAIRQAEMKKTFAANPHLTPADQEAIDRLTTAMFNKALHDPIGFLKRERHSKSQKRHHLSITKEMFGLD